MKKINLKEIKELFILILIAFTIKTCLIEIYIVPTGSMEKNILVGDMLFGNKFVYGMRTPTWIGIPYTRLGFDIPYYRFPKFKEVENNDVVIFEFPRDPFQKYVKRCIGIPGDKISFNEGKIYVNDVENSLPLGGQYLKKKRMKKITYKNTNIRVYSDEKIKEMCVEDGEDVLKKESNYSTLYSLFENEYFYDTNDNHMYDENEIFRDVNKNNKWDYGNLDNIKEFTIPKKGDMIDFDKIDNWEHIINLLILDGNKVELDNWELTVVDPREIARLSGMVKYKILDLIGPKSLNVDSLEQDNYHRYVKELEEENTKYSILTPQDSRIAGSIKDENHLYNNLLINGLYVKDLKEYKIQKDYYFMIGDNRDNSYDSRNWGFVPDDLILGTPVYAFINLNESKFESFFRMKVVN